MKLQTIVQLLPVSTAVPSLQDNTGDIDRLKKNLVGRLHRRRLVVPYDRLAVVAHNFRQAGFTGVAVVNNLPTAPELIDFLPLSPPILPAMALDLGTTHLEASLLDLLSGKTLARTTLENSQTSYGADILTRIHFAANRNGNGEGLAKLHKGIINSVNELAAKLAGELNILPAEIRALCVAGNTTMVHFFLKLDTYNLCREPYIPMLNAPDPCRASALGLNLHPAATVFILPSVGSYFGGDLVAGILTCGLDEAGATGMLIDVGTNAEVVLGNRDWLIACAGAAGPALEGGVARMGMPAAPGAIEHITVAPRTGEVTYSTIDGTPPRGICGSGLIDLVADLYLAELLDIRGKLRSTGKAAGRMIEQKDGPAFIVVPASQSAKGEPILLSQGDLDALMRSKAAMYTILSTLINQVGLTFADLDKIYVAGAFGRHISPRQAIILGMLPDLSLDVYQPVGNSSLAGTEKFLLDKRVRDRAYEIARKITYIELNVNQEFMNRFSGARFIPHTDHSLFPSVPFFNKR